MTDEASYKYSDIKRKLKSQKNTEKAKILQRFFKTKKGEYGAGDKFLGITVPEQRKIALHYKNTPLDEVEKLLNGKYHEERLTALLMLVEKFKNGDELLKRKVFNLYRRNTDRINNWDLVDLSAPNIVGEYLKTRDRLLLYKYARSKNMWERRIAILATFTFIKEGDCTDVLNISKQLLKDREDLIHKAVGWMLREVGKRCGEEKEEEFLKMHAKQMPRTMLRYAIERFPEKKRRFYMEI